MADKYIDKPITALDDAKIFYTAGEYERTINLIKIYEALSGNKDGNDILNKAQQCQQYLEKSRLLIEQGNINAVAECYNHVLVINPNDKSTKKLLDEIYSQKGYIDISRVEFANCDEHNNIISNFGDLLYKDELKYLTAKIYYNGLFTTGKKNVDLYFKIIGPDGKLKTGNSSPTGYTRSEIITIYPGDANTYTTLGWGNNSGGSYPVGRYKYEIWHNSSLLFSTSFEIKTKTQPSTSNSIPATSTTYYASQKQHSPSGSFILRKPKDDCPDIGLIFGNKSTIGIEGNGNLGSLFMGIDAALNMKEFYSESLGDKIKSGAYITGSLGYRTLYWGSAFCIGNYWISSMVDGKETTQTIGIAYGPKIAIYPIPLESSTGVAIYLSYLIVPRLPELSGFKFGVGIRM